MKSRLGILLLALHCLALTAAAQNPAKRQLVLPLLNGGFIAFRSETPGSKSVTTIRVAPSPKRYPNVRAIVALS